ncbi:MAG: ABC transporter ATP-binding protein [Chloroflexi bacterium]|nr:ABC transporter ATP-binding protein [Chloroflexota bacterium]
MIKVENLQKVYGHGQTATHALKGIDVEIKPGEFVAIMGRSGSGKSTLLHILGLLDMPTGGEITIKGKDVLKLSEGERTRFRLEELGYVFQEYSLLAEMTILENVYLPALCLNGGNNYRKRAVEILETVGLGERLKHYPNEVSGGEQQRAAIARALINRPRILFADEPTASLDMTSAKVILELFRKLNRELGQTIVMVTHEPEDEKYVNHVIWLKDGLVEKESRRYEEKSKTDNRGATS